MDNATRDFVTELAKKHDWSCIGEVIFKRIPGDVKKYVSLECVAMVPQLEFTAREFPSQVDLFADVHTTDVYKRIAFIAEHPPYSEDVVVEFEAKLWKLWKHYGAAWRHGAAQRLQVLICGHPGPAMKLPSKA